MGFFGMGDWHACPHIFGGFPPVESDAEGCCSLIKPQGDGRHVLAVPPKENLPAFVTGANGVRANGGQTESGVFILSLRTSGVAQGIFQSEICHRLSHPFFRAVRSAPRDGLADLLPLLLGLRWVEPLIMSRNSW